MVRRLLWVLVAGLAACGDSPTNEASSSPPIPWTAALEEASEPLTDPVVFDALTGLPDGPDAARTRSLVAMAAGAAAQGDARLVASSVATALEALGSEEEGIADAYADVLRLVLGDVQQRFEQAITPPTGTS